MDFEIKQLLEKNLALTEENNRLLRSIRSAARWAALFKFIYIAFFLGSGYFAYQYLEPYLKQVKETQTVYGHAIQEAKDAINKFNMPR